MVDEIKISTSEKSKYLTSWNGQFRHIIYDDKLSDEELTALKGDLEFEDLIREVKTAQKNVNNHINKRVKELRTAGNQKIANTLSYKIPDPKTVKEYKEPNWKEEF